MQGVIRDSHGRAIPGVLLDLQSKTDGQHYSATTNVEGIFRLRDVRLGAYEVKLTRQGFEAQTISSFKVSGPVTLLELALHESSEAVPAATCPSGVPGTPCTTVPAGPTTPYPGMRSPASQEAPAQVAVEQIPPESANFSPNPDRWDIAMPDWRRYETQPDVPYVKGHWYDPFNRNRIKGDYPIFGFTGTSETGFDGRRLPVPSGLNSEDPGNSKFFGRGEQAFVSEDLRLSFDLFRGDTSFRPVDFRVRLTPEINLNFLQTRERGLVNIDTRKGTNRFDTHVGLQEAFVEAKLRDLSPNYDFVSVRAGIQQFTSDFRGFLFSEEQPEGYTTEFSFHHNRDDASVHYDDNGFLVRPAPVGAVVNGTVHPHNIRAYYLGWTGNGHIGRINVSNAFYQALGHDDFNTIAGRRVNINAQMAALELSVDKDWARYRASFFYASGDSSNRSGASRTDGTARGFDSIVDSTHFAGGENSFWDHEGIRLTATGVALVTPMSLLPDLRSSKEEGQANFVNPGIYVFNLGADFEVTPKLRAFVNANYLRFDRTEPLELLLFQRPIRHSIGTDFGAGFEYRPPLSENIVVRGGASALVPGQSLEDIYNGRVLFSLFANVKFQF